MPVPVSSKRIEYRSPLAPTEDHPYPQIYFADILPRLLKELTRRRDYDRTRYQPKMRRSWSNLARVLSWSRNTLVSRVLGRRPLTIATVDQLLFAANISILDLLHPSEITAFLQNMPYEEYTLLTRKIKVLDNRRTQAQNQISAPEPLSQSAQGGNGTE